MLRYWWVFTEPHTCGIKGIGLRTYLLSRFCLLLKSTGCLVFLSDFNGGPWCDHQGLRAINLFMLQWISPLGTRSLLYLIRSTHTDIPPCPGVSCVLHDYHQRTLEADNPGRERKGTKHLVFYQIVFNVHFECAGVASCGSRCFVPMQCIPYRCADFSWRAQTLWYEVDDVQTHMLAMLEFQQKYVRFGNAGAQNTVAQNTEAQNTEAQNTEAHHVAVWQVNISGDFYPHHLPHPGFRWILNTER